MNATYATGSEKDRTTAGALILAVVATVCAVLVIAALPYGLSSGGRTKFMLASAGCEPNLSPSGLNCVTVFMLNNQYHRIDIPDVQQVNADMADYTSNEYRAFSAAEVALKAAVTAEHGFSQSLAAFPFPPTVAPAGHALIRDINAQAKLTARQAQSSSAIQMRSFNSRVKVVSAAVRTDLALVQKLLATPVTPNMEP